MICGFDQKCNHYEMKRQELRLISTAYNFVTSISTAKNKMKAEEPRIFLCYAREDFKTVHKIYERLVNVDKEHLTNARDKYIHLEINVCTQ